MSQWSEDSLSLYFPPWSLSSSDREKNQEKENLNFRATNPKNVY